MKRFSLRLPTLIDYFLYFALVFTLSHMIGIGISLQSDFLQEVLMLLASGSVAVFVVYNPISLYFAATALVFAALIADRYFKDEIFRIYSSILGLTDNIINNFLGNENISKEHMIPYFLLLCFVIGIFTAIIIFKKKSIIILLPIHLTAYLLYWYNFNDQAYRILVLFIAVYLILWSHRAFKTHQTDDRISDSAPHLLIPWISTAAKYSLVVVLLALLLPKTNKHVTLPWLQDYVYKNFPAVEDMRSYDVSSRGIGPAREFSFSTTGFQSNNAILGGPVIENNARVMSIKSSRSLYMRGNVKNTYTGSSWEADVEHPVIYKLLEDMSLLESAEKELFYDNIKATVTYRDFSSTTVFSPLLTEYINSLDTKNILLYKDGTLAAPEGLYDGEVYHLSVLVPKPYGIRLANGQSESIDEIKDLELYLQLPADTISERTIALANEIARDKIGPYGKAAAIEDFLRKNYVYNLDVGFVLPGYDFVDYFLFEEKEGYCTYFASSMAVMLRVVGIPSRYVEGFAVRGPADEGVYEVTNRNAHSWVEAFIEPVGWMTFEPTPALPLPSRLEGYRFEESDSEDYIPVGGMGRDPDGHDEPDKTLDDGSTDGNSLVYSQDALTIILLLASIVLFGVIPGRIFYGILKVSRTEKFIEALAPRERMVHYYEKIVQHLYILDYPINPGETHYEYARRISYKFNDLQGIGIYEITNIFVKSKYGMLEPDAVSIQRAKKYMQALQDRAKKHLGSPKYYWLKYVKGI